MNTTELSLKAFMKKPNIIQATNFLNPFSEYNNNNVKFAYFQSITIFFAVFIIVFEKLIHMENIHGLENKLKWPILQKYLYKHIWLN